MKFLGYRRIKGEKDGKTWDFVQMYIEKNFYDDGSDFGGSQLLTTFSKKRGLGFPVVDANEFVKLLHNGLRSGCQVQAYQDFDGRTIVEVIK